MSPLCNTKKLQLRQCWLLNEIITSNFNQLDQVIVSERLSQLDYFSTSYLNITSDHKAIMVWVPNEGIVYHRSSKKTLLLTNTMKPEVAWKEKLLLKTPFQKRKKSWKNPWKRKSTEARKGKFRKRTYWVKQKKELSETWILILVGCIVAFN